MDGSSDVHVSFVDAYSGLLLLEQITPVEARQLLGKTVKGAQDEVLLPAYHRERLAQASLAMQPGSPGPRVEDAAVSSWEAGTTVLGPKSYDLVLSEQVLVPGMQVTVRLNLETAWDRSIGDTVDIDTARRELLCLELGVLRKHVSAPDAALGDLFSGEWRAQLPRARGRHGGAPNGRAKRPAGAPLPELPPKEQREVSDEVRAVRAEAGRLGARKRWEKARSQKAQEDALAALQQGTQEGEVVEPLDPTMAALSRALIPGPEEEEEEEEEGGAAEGAAGRGQAALVPDPAPPAIKLTAAPAKPGPQGETGKTTKSLHSAYLHNTRPYGAIWFRCKLCNVEVAGARNAVAHSRTPKCRRNVLKRQEETNSLSCPKWMVDVFPEAATGGLPLPLPPQNSASGHHNHHQTHQQQHVPPGMPPLSIHDHQGLIR